MDLGGASKRILKNQKKFQMNREQAISEAPINQGKIDFPLDFSKMKQIGYSGTLTIEREISGSQQIADIKAAVEFLRPLC